MNVSFYPKGLLITAVFLGDVLILSIGPIVRWVGKSRAHSRLQHLLQSNNHVGNR
jgi:hypothetical protein